MAKKNTFEKRALSIREAAEYACVSRATIENWLSQGVLPFEELPGRGTGIYSFKRIRKHDLDELLKNSYRTSKDTIKSTLNVIDKEPFLLPREG